MYLGFICWPLFMNIGLFWHTCGGSEALSRSRPACRAQRERLFYWSLLMCVGLFCRSLLWVSFHVCRSLCVPSTMRKSHVVIYTNSYTWVRDKFMSDMTQSYVWPDSFIRLSWIVYLRDMLSIVLELQCVAVCCSVLQCVAVCCSVLQCVAVCCSVLHRSVTIPPCLSLVSFHLYRSPFKVYFHMYRSLLTYSSVVFSSVTISTCRAQCAWVGRSLRMYTGLLCRSLFKYIHLFCRSLFVYIDFFCRSLFICIGLV